MKKSTNQPNVLAVLADDTKTKNTKAELALAQERASEKKLIWKALNYSFHVYSKRGKVAEAIEMSDMLKKYFPNFEDVAEDFDGMIQPKYVKRIKR